MWNQSNRRRSAVLAFDFAGGFLANGEWQAVPWWDDGVVEGIGAATSLEIVKAAGVGAGNFHVWYMIRRIGAGSGGNDQ